MSFSLILLTVNSIYMLMILLLFLLLMMLLNYNLVLTISLLSIVVGVHNCIVVNPAKSNFLLYNTDNVVISIDSQMINNTNCAKYLGLYIDNRLSWNYA
jgi:hypothetical protein